MTQELFDAVLVGGGPANLSAALALGRARRRVLLVDAGPRRNAAATHVNNFLTRDGTPPDEMRRIGREQLGRYPSVTLRDEAVHAITGERGAFRVSLEGGDVTAKRLLLGTGMIDEEIAIEGFAERWGHAIYQCPYCHGWDVRERPWGFLMTPHSAGHALMFGLLLTQWTDTLTVFTQGIPLADEDAERLRARGVRVEASPVRRLTGPEGALRRVELEDGGSIECEALFAHPPQRHVPLVAALGLELDEAGYVKVDGMRRETSTPGIFAAGDLTTPVQGALLGAAQGTQAAAVINVDLAMDPR